MDEVLVMRGWRHDRFVTGAVAARAGEYPRRQALEWPPRSDDFRHSHRGESVLYRRVWTTYMGWPMAGSKTGLVVRNLGSSSRNSNPRFIAASIASRLIAGLSDDGTVMDVGPRSR